MARTLQQRIEARVGSLTSITDEANQWVLDGFYLLSWLLPKEYLMGLAVLSAAVAEVTVATTLRVMAVFNSTSKRPASEVSLLTAYGQSTNTNSIHTATAAAPIWFREDGKIKQLPGNGDFFVLEEPVIAVGTDVVIGNTPAELEETILLYASIQKILYDLSAINLAALTIDVPPNYPSVPTLTWASWTPITPPPDEKMDQPIVTDLVLSKEIDGVTTLVLPSVPSAATITGAAGSPATASASAMPDVGSEADDIDFSAPAYAYDPESEWAGNLDRITALEALFTAINTHVAANDFEEAQALVATVGQELGLVGTEIQHFLNKFNTEHAIWQQEIAVKIEQARSATQVSVSNAQMSTDASVRAAANSTQASVATATHIYEKYSQEVARFNTLMNQHLTEYVTNKIQKDLAYWHRQSVNWLERYPSDIQNERAKAMTINEVAQGKLQAYASAFQRHSLEIQDDQTKFQTLHQDRSSRYEWLTAQFQALSAQFTNQVQAIVNAA